PWWSPYLCAKSRLCLPQSFAFFTCQLAFNGNAGEVGGHFQGMGFRWVRTARFAAIHGKRAQRFARMRQDGSGPAGAKPVRLGRASIQLPERILENVGDDNRLSAVHGGAA